MGKLSKEKLAGTFFPPLTLIPYFLAFWLILERRLGIDDYFYLFRSGKIFLGHGGILGKNLFSFTAPDYPWINHAWGSGVAFAFLEPLGLRALPLLSALSFLVCAALFHTSLRLKMASGLLLVLGLLFSLFIGLRYGAIRPWIFGNIFFLFQIYLWANSSKAKRPLLVLCASLLCLLLWVNSHGSFLLGVLLHSLLCLSLFWSRKTKLLPASILGAAGLLAPFASPYPWSEFIAVPLRFGFQYTSENDGPISFLPEWQPIFTHLVSFDDIALLVLFSAVLLAFFSCFLLQKKWDRVFFLKLSFFVVTTLLTLQAKRHFYFFFVGNLVLFAGELNSLFGRYIPRVSWKKERLLDWLLLPFLLSIFFLAGTREILDPGYWPPGLISHIGQNKAKYEKGVYWDFDFANIPIYLPDLGQKVFFDGRQYCYPPEVIHDFYRINYGKLSEVVAVSEQWGLNYFVVKRGSHLDSVLKSSPPFKVVYQDDFSLIYSSPSS
ncbi:MAG: hypothetical protein ACXVBE_06035 [Bdellovibrionota bacterium]